MQLDIESLRVLLAVLDHGGMTKAATQLNMGQSAVSRKIQRLEQRVGSPLLIRDGHTLRPTRDGRALLADARQMVDLHDRAVARLHSSDLTGTVKLSSNGEVDLTAIASLLGTFRCRHPGAVVEFSLDHSGNLTEAVDAGIVDLAIVQTTSDQRRPTDIELWSEDLRWTAADGVSFTEPPIPLIDFGSCCYYNRFVSEILDEADVAHRRVFSAASSQDVGAAVAAGIGVAVMSARYVTGDLVEWKPPTQLGPLPRVAQVIRSVPGERPDAVAALIETIQSELRPRSLAAPWLDAG